MLPLKLFECNTGGAKYWCAALHAEHARELLLIVSEEQGSDPEPIEDARIYEIPETRAKEIDFPNDGRSLWEEFRLSDVEPRVLGCTEWP
jgi:hypothetical protein